MSSEKKSPMEKAATLIRELEMRELQDAEKYEKCETIARLAPQEVVDLIDDPQVKEGVTWLKKAHRDIPSLAKWRKTFAQTIQLLFKEAGGIDRVKKWHELEEVCDKISEEELKNIDKNSRDAITWVQHIHDNSPERRLEIIRRINSEINCF
ncbi:hypothetical protein ES703_00546 [subsurface metagenome]